MVKVGFSTHLIKPADNDALKTLTHCVKFISVYSRFTIHMGGTIEINGKEGGIAEYDV